MIRSLLRLLVAAALLAPALPAQESGAGKPAEARRQARFLAIGDSPPYAQEISDGVRYELEPPADSIPPRQVTTSADGQAASTVELRLGRISGPVKVPPGAGPFDLRKIGSNPQDPANPQSAPWLRLNRPEKGNFLALLFRPSGKGTWLEPAHLVLPEGTVDSLRIINLLPVPARIVWAGESSLLAPGKIQEHRIEPGGSVPFQIYTAGADGAAKRHYAGTATQNPGERGLVLIYPADGTSPRRPVKVSMLREPVQARTGLSADGAVEGLLPPPATATPP